MENNIEKLLEDKFNYLEKIFNITTEQKMLIEKKDFNKFLEKDEEKRQLIANILELDKLIEPNNLKNKKNSYIIQDKVKKINFILYKLINIEKEIAENLSKENLLLSGKHIEVYKKIIK